MMSLQKRERNGRSNTFLDRFQYVVVSLLFELGWGEGVFEPSLDRDIWKMQSSNLTRSLYYEEIEFSQFSKLSMLLKAEKDLLRWSICSGFRLFIFCWRIRGKGLAKK
jgi:hypothetical protein